MGVGPKSLNLLHSSLSRQFTEYCGTKKWRNEYEICATLFFGIIKNHPFHDANKRTALLTTLYHLQKIGRWPDEKQKVFEDLTVNVAQDGLIKYTKFKEIQRKRIEDPEIYFLADFFKSNTKAINKRRYLVTYQQLNALLNRHSFDPTNPHKNFIDVVKVTRRKEFFIFGKEITKNEKVTQIGFPGWKKEASNEDIQKVRKAAKLLPENGVDSDAFFHGADSLQSLISLYQRPLERLANK